MGLIVCGIQKAVYNYKMAHAANSYADETMKYSKEKFGKTLPSYKSAELGLDAQGNPTGNVVIRWNKGVPVCIHLDPHTGVQDAIRNIPSRLPQSNIYHIAAPAHPEGILPTLSTRATDPLLAGMASSRV